MATGKFRMISAEESDVGGFLRFFILALARVVGIVIGLVLIFDVVHAAFAQHGQSTATGLLYWRSSERVRLTFTPGSGMTEIPTPS